MKGKVVIMVADTTISDLGKFTFSDPADIERRLTIAVTRNNHQFNLRTNKDEESEKILALMRPMLAAGIGELGKNMALLTFDNTDEQGQVLFDFYAKSSLTAKFDGMVFTFEAPADALFVPRLLSNGKPAHVSWVYNPWTGEKIDTPTTPIITP
jgi:hypothetical protein